MQTFGALVTDYLDITKDDSSENEVFGTRRLNEIIRKVLYLRDWTFNEDSKDITTVASQRAYDLPSKCYRMKRAKFVSGSTTYTLKEVVNGRLWSKMYRSSSSSSILSHYYINENNQIEVYPEPSSAGDTITVYFSKKVPDFTDNDYSVGTITVTDGSVYVVGDGTAWTERMKGRWFKAYDDGLWYKIEGYTNQGYLTLDRSFDSDVSVSGGTYIIGSVIPLPDGFENIPLWGAAAMYFRKRGENIQLAQEYERKFSEGIGELIRRDTRSEGTFIESQKDIEDWFGLINPNCPPQDLT